MIIVILTTKKVQRNVTQIKIHWECRGGTRFANGTTFLDTNTYWMANIKIIVALLQCKYLSHKVAYESLALSNIHSIICGCCWFGGADNDWVKIRQMFGKFVRILLPVALFFFFFIYECSCIFSRSFILHWNGFVFAMRRKNSHPISMESILPNIVGPSLNQMSHSSPCNIKMPFIDIMWMNGMFWLCTAAFFPVPYTPSPFDHNAFERGAKWLYLWCIYKRQLKQRALFSTTV